MRMMKTVINTPILKLIYLVVLTVFLTACSSERASDEQWVHSELGSYASAFSPDGKYVLVGDTDLPAKLWDIEENKIVYSWQNRPEEAGTTTSVGFSGDGKIAATSEQDVIVLWNMADGEPMLRLSFPVKIKALALSHRGDYLLLALYDRTAVYFDVIANRVVKIFEHDGLAVNAPINQLINSVAISPDGKFALTGADDQTARLWNLESGDLVHSWKHKNAVNIVAFYPNGGYALTGAGNGKTHFWNMETGEELYTLRMSSWPKTYPEPDFPAFLSTTSAIDFSPDYKYLVTGHPSQRICVWAVANGAKQGCWQVARRDALRPGVVLQAVSFSKDGRSVYSESGNGVGQKWILK
jgi:WD40 repeat protein